VGKRETDISNTIRVALSGMGCRVFRNHRGKHLTLDGKRVVTTGLFPGASDLIGWTTIVVTPEMVGKQVAVFTSIEVKSGRDGATDEQDQWLQAVRGSGGIGACVREPSEAEQAIRVNLFRLECSRVRV
jgi:hypothetical protein